MIVVQEVKSLRAWLWRVPREERGGVLSIFIFIRQQMVYTPHLVHVDTLFCTPTQLESSVPMTKNTNLSKWSAPYVMPNKYYYTTMAQRI